MDAGQMVYLAEHWNTVPPQQRYEIEGQDKNRFTFSILIFWRVDTQTFNHVISGYVDFWKEFFKQFVVFVLFLWMNNHSASQ